MAQTDAAPPASPEADASIASAPVNPAALTAARRVVLAAHLQELLLSSVDNMVPVMLAPLIQAYHLTPEQQSAITRAVTDEVHHNPGPLVDMIALSYARHLSAADLNALADFYETEAGQHMLATRSDIQRELLAVGQTWGRQVLGPRIQQRLNDVIQHPPAHS
jgi:hypothetical protein